MASIYYDFSAGVNGSGTSASPKNAWDAPALSPGDFVYFRRGTTMSTNVTLTAGTSGNVIKYSTYYNADGTDNTSIARPIVNINATMSTLANHRDYVWIDSWDIRASLPAAADSSVIFLGTGGTVNNCAITSNVGCIGSYGKSNITITNNTLFGCTNATVNNNILIVSATFNVSNILIQGNTLTHDGGGLTTSNGMRLESTSGNVSTLQVLDNVIRGTTGIFFLCDNLYAIGMRIQNCPNAHIARNTVMGMLEGIWFFGSLDNQVAGLIEYNSLTYNRHFGIHLTTDAVGCFIQYNVCSFNGTSTYDATGALKAYGRGIECSSAAGQSRCSGHLIRFNVCNGNLNYGGSLDNGSEGIGIGLDDSTTNCIVYGNTCKDNEGNGIQLYGGSIGSGTPAISDTGGNQIVANLLVSNCTASFTNRRSGGTFTNLFCAHIALASTTSTSDARRTLVLNNVMTGTTEAGVSQDSNCTNVFVHNNIFYNVDHPVMLGWTPAATAHRNNIYFNAVQTYSTMAVDGNGEAAYILKVYTGTNDKTYDPDLDADYRPSNTSTAVGDGFSIGFGTYDFAGGLFRAPPTIGMFEVAPPHMRSLFGGRMRKKIAHGMGH